MPMKIIRAAYWVFLILLLIFGFWCVAEGKARYDARTHAQVQSGKQSLSRAEGLQEIRG